MSIALEQRDLVRTQQMEVAVNGPDGATHLILCTGVANLNLVDHDTYTFLVGPHLSRRQFVGVIASGALSTNETSDQKTGPPTELGVNLVLINANYDEESRQVKGRAEIAPDIMITKLAISYNVSILAELPKY